MLRTLRNTAFFACTIALVHGTAAAGTPYKIVTASERGTYIQIGRDLAKYVAPAADADLEVLPRPNLRRTCSGCATSRA